MRVAEVWADLVRELFDVAEPFMSEENIGAGERGLTKIAAELAGTSFGIIVVTQENQSSQWLNYEAGALSKDLNDQTVRVAPSLVDFARKNDVTGPLGQFQASMLDKNGVKHVLLEIAKVVEADEAAVTKRFNNAWNQEYEARFDEARQRAHDAPRVEHQRSSDEILDEVLTIVRELARVSPAEPRELATVSPAEPRNATYTKEEIYEGLSRALEPLSRDYRDLEYKFVFNRRQVSIQVMSALWNDAEFRRQVKSTVESAAVPVGDIRFLPPHRAIDVR